VVAAASPVAKKSKGSAAWSCSHARCLSAKFLASLTGLVKKPLEGAADTDLLRNDLSIEAIPATSTLVGTNVMTVESTINGLSQFTFRLADNFAISQVLLNGSPIGHTRLDSATVRANLGTTFNDGQIFSLTVSYSGVPTSGSGFGSIVFRTRSSSAREVFTLSEPWYSYTWWPSKDENTDKALTDIAVTVPNTMVVAANGLLQGVDLVSGGRLRYRWSSQYPIATYLVSFAATNFNTWTSAYDHSGGSMPVSFFIYPESDTTGNRAGWNASVQMIATFSTIFGQYPFVNEKYGIYNFGFGGGMEHQTMTGQGGFGESLTAHELAHQWWGDMITCETWHDIWLNEGFATYGEALWLERKPGSTGLPALKSAMASRKPGNVNGSVYRYNIGSLGSIFSSDFSYRKGGWVLHQLRHIVGDAAFFAILAEFRNRYVFDSATTEDFISVAESVYGRPLRWYFDPWVYGVGAVAYRWGTQTKTVNGQQYLLVSLRQTQSSNYPVFAMPVDLRYTVGGSPITEVLWNTAATQHYVFPVSGGPSSLALDPDGWVLTTSVGSEAYLPGPPKVVRVFPPPGPASDNDLGEIRVTFHTPVNASAAAFSLRTRTGVPVPFAFRYDGTGNMAILTPWADLDIDGMELTVRDTIIATDSGMALDGECPDFQTVPTGDGLPGGTAVIRIGY
jgi:aminopeptidase N